MNVQGAKKKCQLSKPALILATPILIIGGIIDFLVNLGPFSVIMLEFPTQLTVTARLKSHVNEEGWRGNVARSLGKHVLNPFDPTGDHLD